MDVILPPPLSDATLVCVLRARVSQLEVLNATLRSERDGCREELRRLRTEPCLPGSLPGKPPGGREHSPGPHFETR